MESTTICSSLPSLSEKSLHLRKLKFGHGKRLLVRAVKRSDSYDRGINHGLLVDESMIVLRKRIHEMEMIERNYEPPRDWMEWEKQYYTRYDELICSFVGFLQMNLMNTRPSLAIGMLLLVAMSIPVSTVTIMLRFMQATNEILSAVRLG